MNPHPSVLIVLAWLLTHGLQALAQDRLGITTLPAGTEKRVALVIGNRDYQHMSPLRNPLNDAADMTRALKDLHFEVITLSNTTYQQFSAGLETFRQKITTAHVALVYFSGHGLSYNGTNYLIPVDARIDCQEDIDSWGIKLDWILGVTKNGRNGLVFLDACRKIPSLNRCPSPDRDPSRKLGFVPPNNPLGSAVIYSTEQGTAADDNQAGRNGLFTEALLRYLTQPDLTLKNIVDKAATDVETKSNYKQSPALYDKIRGDFVFLQTSPLLPTPSPKQPNRDLPPFMETVYIPGGTFDMGNTEGSDSEKPVHTVTVSPFRMGKYEVTVSQFAQFIAETKYQTDAEEDNSSSIINQKMGSGKDSTGINWRYDEVGNRRPASEYNHPVIHVSHNDAIAFCAWLSKREKRSYRLPTEAEWEYAAGNGAAHTKYSWGNDNPSGKAGNVADETAKATSSKWTVFSGYRDGYLYTSPVGLFDPNKFGLHDMTGNVLEWCRDWYSSDYYVSSTNANPTGPNTGSYRVLRGGSWRHNPQYCRVAYRGNNPPSKRNASVGFRVVFQAQ